MRLYAILLLVLGLSLAGRPAAHAQTIKKLFGKNNLNRQKEHAGRWEYKEDKENPGAITSKGRFKNGKQVKKWKYFYPNGRLYLVEKYDSKKDTRVLNATYYHPNGNVMHVGQAIQENTKEKMHYYWIGQWQYYNEDGSLQKTVLYDKGWPVKSIYPDGREEKETAERFQSGPRLQSL